MTKPPHPSLFLLLLLALLLHGCVYLPRTTSSYNPVCRTIERRMVLEEHQVATLMGCHNEACVTALALAGVVSATTAVISGSITLVGNAVFWLERETNACLR